MAISGIILRTSADVAFFGGAAGGGKTYALLLEACRHVCSVRGFGAVYFRRIMPEITREGGPWYDSFEIYSHLEGESRVQGRYWRFPPYDNKITFSHMEYEKTKHQWKSAQVPLLIFDQLEDFTRGQFIYMFSRNRSTCGVSPYIRGAYNPVPREDKTGGWLHEFVGWYLDKNGEYPDPAKAGVIRWFVNVKDSLHWFDSKSQAVAEFPHIPPKSFTYIPSSVYDNKILLEKDPSYLANLHGLDNIDMERLLKANHKIRPEAGKVFNKAWFEVVEAVPAAFDYLCRFWDLAASEKKQKGHDPDYTAGVLMGVNDGIYYVIDVIEERISPAATDSLMYNTATQDGRHVPVRWEEEGGASGKRDSRHIAAKLAGWDGAGVRPQGDKLTRSKSLAAQARAGNVKVLNRQWAVRFLEHMHSIPEGAHDDIHDATAGAFNELVDWQLLPAQDVVLDDTAVSISPY